MTPPDTETDETFVAALEDAFAEAESADGLPEGTVLTDLFMGHLEPVLAQIRRQAAADALTEQARSLGKLGSFMREQARAHVAKGNTMTAVSYDAMADTYYSSANKLTKAAADKLAEGYEFECAALAQECDQRVPDAGDYCPKHEPEDDENRWAE